MLQNGFVYAIQLLKEDGTALERVELELDWDPAKEWTRFLGIRRGRLPPNATARGSRVEPIWNSKLGSPYLAGLRVTVSGREDQTSASDIPLSYVSGPAQQAAARCLKTGLLQAGEHYRYHVLALPNTAGLPSEEAPETRFAVKEIAAELPLVETPLNRFLTEAVPFGQSEAEDMPVFIPQHVLDEAVDLTRKAGSLETGGVLIGHLHRDATVPEIFAEVTAQIRAKHTVSELTRLTFTEDTWAAVQTAIDARDKNESYLGWWHCHCYMKETCKDCDQQKEGACKASAAFMSTEDCALHRAIFPGAYSVALVISDSPCAGMTWELFGWRSGIIAPRGFHITNAEKSAVDATDNDNTDTQTIAGG